MQGIVVNYMYLGVKNLKYDNSYIHHNDEIFAENCSIANIVKLKTA